MCTQPIGMANVALSAGGGGEMVEKPAAETTISTSQATAEAGGGSGVGKVAEQATNTAVQGKQGYNTVQGPNVPHEHTDSTQIKADKATHGVEGVVGSRSIHLAEAMIKRLQNEVRGTMITLEHAERLLDQGVELQEQLCEKKLRDEMQKHKEQSESLGIHMIRGKHQVHMSQLSGLIDRRDSKLKLGELLAAIRDTRNLMIAEKLKGVEHVVNRYCRPSQGMADELAISQATEDDDGISDELIYTRLDLDRYEEMAIATEPLFISKNIGSIGPQYQATAADLMLRTLSGTERLVKGCIIDSGAARCAMDYDHMTHWFPGLQMRTTTRAFHDASGNVMNIKGEVDLGFRVGDLQLWTTVYVFKNLGHSFLLGVNAIKANGLTISSERSIMYSEKPEATEHSHLPITMQLCNDCNSSPAYSMKAAADCICNGINVIYCKDESSIMAKSHAAEYSMSMQCYAVDAVSPKPEKAEQTTEVRVKYKTEVRPGEAVVIPLEYGVLKKGTETTAEVCMDPLFKEQYPDIEAIEVSYHSTLNLHAHVRIRNVGTRKMLIKANTLFGKATYHNQRPRTARATRHESINLVREGCADAVQKFKVAKVDRASGLEWKLLGSEPPGQDVTFTDGVHRVSDKQLLECEVLSSQLPQRTSFSKEEWAQLGVKKQLLTCHYVRGQDGNYYSPTQSLPFSEGGRPRTIEDLHQIGFSLDKAINPSKPKGPDGSYPPLEDELKNELYEVALEFWYVWSRDTRAPEISRLVVIDIPTGNATPIAQKPYPIPYAYLDAAREELQKLIDAGLIEPCISNWASPVLVRLKKDSTPDKIRLKLICDFRRLNEVTVPDSAGLGDQEEILDGFGGDQRWGGITDAAGGFYQLLINPAHRSKTAICLPTSMGGTQFQWRVAPYGLTRNPAGYSRGMMFALKGLNHCVLDHGNAHGGAASWIDDISMHASSFNGFKDLFRKVLTRLAFAGMSLKATKTYLLHQELEVLGFFITPDGIIMQPEALARIESCGRTIERRDEKGKMIGPSSIKEIRTFLGAVQFYRRFVPRIALLAAPMHELLKKMSPKDPRLVAGSKEHTTAWDAVQQSFEAIMLFLRSSAIVSAPDLRDPYAEFVIVCDACDVAAGGVLLQWQYPGSNGPGPPAGVPLRGGVGPDPLTQSWRLGAGWKLRTIGYFHKTFNSAQVNYPTFDQEGAAILACCRRWSKLITGRPTTIYTDSSVAATMLTKHMGTLRLATWGIELGTFMPYLKIQHRKGSQNGLADFISRYPTFQRYVKRPRDELQLPPGVFDRVASVPLFTHEIANEEEARVLTGWSVDLVETSHVTEAEKFWNKPENLALLMEPSLDDSEVGRQLLDQVAMLREEVVSHEHFWREQLEFEEYVHSWDIYADIFRTTHDRKPVLWDLCCGEGGYSRGARNSGLDCYGFDIKAACKHRYEHEPSADGLTRSSGMTFTVADVLSDEFWRNLKDHNGALGDLPLPDIIHISPDCSAYSRLSSVGGGKNHGDTCTLNYLIRKLKEYERHCATHHGKHLLWQIENVPDSRQYVTEKVDFQVLLCGTMMGHQTFRHRVIYCNFPVSTPHGCRHEGKYVGARGVRFNAAHNDEKFAHLPEANMYGVYSRPDTLRGTADAWHGAIGHIPATFSEKGLRGALPIGYGRLLSGQALAHSLHRQFACPVIPPGERTPDEQLALESWACNGYCSLSQLNFLGLIPPADPAPEPILSQQTARLGAPTSNKEVLESESPTTKYPPEAIEPDAESPYLITAQDQRCDPVIARLFHTLQTAKQSSNAQWALQDGRVCRLAFSAANEPLTQVYVPCHRRSQLLAQFHYANHRGSRPLFQELSKNYYWPNMASDCVTFTNTCNVCAPLGSRPLEKVVTNPIPTPGRPFTVIHVDHADFRGRVSGPQKYQYVLVVTCALTRFTLFIPVSDLTAESTLKQLNKNVFCIFGPPLVMVSDNGKSFVNDLSNECARFWGYRHIHILPYNSQANGIVESSVKRIKLLLDRHCAGHKSWHVQLPTLQLKLNADVHSGTGVSPYVALFGREPVGIEQLEDPSLYPADEDGEGFVHELRGRLLHAHETLREHSDDLKRINAAEQNARLHARLNTSKHGVVEASTADEPKYAWLIHGSKAQAAYVAKHGHGLPWKHKYKVLEVRPHAVRLEVPTDGSVPRVNEWQLRRRVARAPADSHAPDESAPIITEAGLLRPGSDASVRIDDWDGDPYSGDERVYDIEKIAYAERVGRYYKIWIKWSGHDELTWRWRHELIKESSNAEVLQQVDDAVAAEKLRLEQTKSDSYAENDDELQDASSEVEEPLLGRGAPRLRKTPDTFKFAVFEAAACFRRDLQAVQNYVVPCGCVC